MPHGVRLKKLAPDGVVFMIRPMKTFKFACVVGLLVVSCSSVATAATAQVLGAGARYHQKHSEFISLPYADEDLTYGIVYEIHEDNALLQLACGFTPEFADHEEYDYGITPEANLLMKDGVFQGGLGILSTYTAGGPEDGDWMDMYWQFVLGLNFPLGKRLSLQANAYYVFEEWGALGGFDFADIEFGGYLGYKF